jgi:hypothetical protein
LKENQVTTTMTSTAAQSDYLSAEIKTTAPDLIPGTEEVTVTTESPLKEFWNELKSLIKELIEYARYKCWKKKVLTAVVFIASVLVFWDLIFGGYIVLWLEEFVLWMTHHSIEAVFAFIAIFVVSTCECISRRDVILRRFP